MLVNPSWSILVIFKNLLPFSHLEVLYVVYRKPGRNGGATKTVGSTKRDETFEINDIFVVMQRSDHFFFSPTL